ncbi:MAG: hypothetical protein GY786_10610 [Proteobacteria bacterium]|nr:hypothetical protein [Pseudomonadota bacterium]
MKKPLPVPEGKKLSVTFRVEPGCLGPDGVNKVTDFCWFVQNDMQSLDADYVAWNIVPRGDKNLPEMEYSIVGKKMTHSQAEKYLACFDENLDKLESSFIKKLTVLIHNYMGH